MGKVSDIYGRKPVIIVSLVASSLGYIMSGLAESVLFLFASRIVCGICGGTMPVAQSMVIDVVDDFKQRPKYLGLTGGALGVGFIVGPAMGAAGDARRAARHAARAARGAAARAATARADARPRSQSPPPSPCARRSSRPRA